MDPYKFTLKEEHLKLLRSAYIGWNDVEFGAPEIDPKRPYGNSWVFGDIAEILEIEPDNGEEFSEEQKDFMNDIHAGTQRALQILIMTLDAPLGHYEAERYTKDWKLVETSSLTHEQRSTE